MRQTDKWLVPAFLGMTLIAAASAGGCAKDPAGRLLTSAVDSSGSDSTPRDSVPRDSVPRDSVPRDSVPRDSVPPDTTTRDSLPPPTAASITVWPESQERTVGDSGTVSATVRDAAGHEIRSAQVEWDVTDTSTVVRIRARGAAYLAFDAVGVGRAVLIARYERLADTAVVFVH